MNAIECPLEVMGQSVPFSDELIGGHVEEAAKRLSCMEALDAVRLVLVACRCDDAVIGDSELDRLAEYLGCFQE